MADWTHKLVETRMMKVAELMDMLNPDNPRIHPQEQTDAIEELIDKVGFIDEIKVSRRSGKIINGHDRTKLAMIRGQSELPVNFYDLTEEEEAMALRFYDATGAMAEFDLEKLQRLAEISKPIEQDLEALGALMEKVRRGGKFSGEEVDDPLAEWEDMPEFIQEDASAFRTIKVHFLSQDAVDEFSGLIEQRFSEKTHYIYHPRLDKEDLTKYIAHDKS